MSPGFPTFSRAAPPVLVRLTVRVAPSITTPEERRQGRDRVDGEGDEYMPDASNDAPPPQANQQKPRRQTQPNPYHALGDALASLATAASCGGVAGATVDAAKLNRRFL